MTQPRNPAPKQSPLRAAQRQQRSRNEAEVRRMLQDGEKIIRIATIHDAIYWKGAVVTIIGLLLMLTVFNLGVFLTFVGLVLLSSAYLKKYYLLLVLTSKRIILRYGIAQLEAVHIQLNRVESVELSWTILGRWLGYAMVFVTGTGSRVTVIPFVADSQAFRNDLERILNARDEVAIKAQRSMAQDAPPPDSETGV